MIKATNKAPCPRPRECFKVEIAYIVQDIVVVPSDATNYEKLIFVEHSSMSGSSFWNRASHCRLCPMCSLQVEYNEVGEIGSVFILAAENEEFVPLVERGGMPCLSLERVHAQCGELIHTHSNAGNVTIVVNCGCVSVSHITFFPCSETPWWVQKLSSETGGEHIPKLH